MASELSIEETWRLESRPHPVACGTVDGNIRAHDEIALWRGDQELARGEVAGIEVVGRPIPGRACIVISGKAGELMEEGDILRVI